MTVTVSKDNNFPSGEIKFSALRDTFRGTGTTTTIKASELFRNTNNNRRYDIVVPDATENAAIAGDDYTGEGSTFSGDGNNLSLLTFRNSITYYHLNQTDKDSKLDLDTPSQSDSWTWNGNLPKNVLKKINVNGTIYSDDNTIPALQIGDHSPGGDIKIRNLTIHAHDGGKILGSGGKGGTHMNWWKPGVVSSWTANDANFTGGTNQPNQSGMNTYAIFAKPVNVVNFGVHTYEGTLTIPTTGNYYFKWAVDDAGTLTFNGSTASSGADPFTTIKTETYNNLAAGIYDIKFTVTNVDQSPSGSPNDFVNNPGGIAIRLYNDANETIWSTLDLLSNIDNIGNGEDGGDALYAASYNVDDTPVSRLIFIQADTGSQIYGGGGGGGAGYTGGTGGQGGGVVGANGGQPGAGGKGGVGGEGAGYGYRESSNGGPQNATPGESGYAGGLGEIGGTKQYLISDYDNSGARTFHGGVGGSGGKGGKGGDGGDWGQNGEDGNNNGRRKGNRGGSTEPDAFLFKVPHRPFSGMTLTFSQLNKHNIPNYKGASYHGRADAVTDDDGNIIGYKTLYYSDSGGNSYSGKVDINGRIRIFDTLDDDGGGSRTIAPNARFTKDGWGITADGPGWFRLHYDSPNGDQGSSYYHFDSFTVNGTNTDGSAWTHTFTRGSYGDDDIQYQPNVVDGNLLTFFATRNASNDQAMTIGGNFTNSGNPPWDPLTNSIFSAQTGDKPFPPGASQSIYIGDITHQNSASWHDSKLVWGPVWFYDKSKQNSKKNLKQGDDVANMSTWSFRDADSQTELYQNHRITPVVMDNTDVAGNNIGDLMYWGNVQGDKGEGQQGGLPLPDDGGIGGAGGDSITGYYYDVVEGSDPNSIKGHYST